MWFMVAQRLTQITPPAATPDHLWQREEAAWSAVPQEHIQSLFESMPRRVAATPTVHPRPSPETNQRPSLTPINLRFINGVWETVHEKRLIKLFYDIKTAPGDERFLNLFGQQSLRHLLNVRMPTRHREGVFENNGPCIKFQVGDAANIGMQTVFESSFSQSLLPVGTGTLWNCGKRTLGPSG
ncbi:transposable element Tcb1 transposase [Trichonephila clavipes]|uniref:Transposable element Tcb1 transposase n=1 Tax=Trichonephila clavipes TaxID=2585209 RepID=A0A8X6SNK5_TRICX|nr:transposable element Tcb1 transposase [Trichonephila clavipes]